MSEKKISYSNRTFDDYRNALLEQVKTYYPQISDRFDDASVGSWLIDMAAAIGDNLSYHMDRVYNETTVDGAQQSNSVYALARNNGVKVAGPKPSIAEELFTCTIPVVSVYDNSSSVLGMPNWEYAPKIKKGTKLSTGSQDFEVMEDIDFKEAFDSNGNADRVIEPNSDANGKIVSYNVSKYSLVQAGTSKVYKAVLSSNDVGPFMEFILPDKNVTEVESIIFKDSSGIQSDPSIDEFMNPNEYVPATDSPSKVDTYRFFEVDSFLDHYRWGDDINSRRFRKNVGEATTYKYGYYDGVKNVTVPTYSVTKGEWIPLTQKFVTEYTDNGYLKVVFGAGETVGETVNYDGAQDFTKYQISKMVRNNFMGKLPKAGWTMYVRYRTGGGIKTNVAKDTIKRITNMSVEIGKCIVTREEQNMAAAVRNSITATNTTPSVAGKDSPTTDEIKALIKYRNAAQDRCVTLKDYIWRLSTMPSRYGVPYKVAALEENNKVMLYMLGIDGEGKLTSVLPEQMLKNIASYLSMYRSMNDYVELKGGKIINISFDADIMVDKSYDAASVVNNVISVIRDYMDTSKHELGEDIYVSDIEKEITKVNGVSNLIGLRIYNEYGDGYSSVITSQETLDYDPEDKVLTENDINFASRINSGRAKRIDLEASNYILNSEVDEMFEIKYPERDIRCRVKTR